MTDDRKRERPDERARTVRGRRPAFFDGDADGGADEPTVANPEAWEEGASVAAMLEHVREARGAWPETEREVAEGGMARVYAVHAPGLERRVAMKLISRELVRHRESVAWFIREAQVTGQLDHPNIVPVHELGVTWDGLPYFTMKLVEGRTLGALVKALPPGAVDRESLLDLLGVIIKVCDALAFAHSRGVIHADLKPSNVMVGEFGQVYLMDWGIARLVGRGPSDAPVVDEGRVVQSWVRAPLPRGAGSPGFMSPEQAAGHDLDERSDVFGVGALIYYVLARRAIYEGDSALDVFNRALDGDIRPLQEIEACGRVPVRLRRIVERAMAADRAERYPSVIELQADLQRFVRGGGDFPIVSFRTGQPIIRQGEQADAAYAIVTGRCEVSTTVDGERRHLAWLGPGDVFGETAILADSDRTATVEARESTTCVRIPIEVFQRELDDMTPWMVTIARALARRFRDQLERSHGGGRRDAAPNAAVVFSFLATWAAPRPADARTMTVSALVDHLGGPDVVDRAALLELLLSRPELRVAASDGHLAVVDVDALRSHVCSLL